MAISNPRIEELSRLAGDAMRAGQPETAARFWEQVVAVDPNHPVAIFHLGQHALLKKDIPRAFAMLQQAAKLSPLDPVIQLNIAFSYRAMGDGQSELASLDSALALDPYFFPAMMAKGAFLERAGKHRLAARIYKDVLTIAPPDEQLPLEFRSALARARDIVRDNAIALEAFLEKQLKMLTASKSTEELERFSECRGVMAGTKKIYAPRPTLLHFPGLPATQFYDNKEFPDLRDVELATNSIRQELIDLLSEGRPQFGPYVTRPEGSPLNQWADLNFSPRWSAFFLWKDGKPIAENCGRCPKTAAVLEKADMAVMEGYAPTAFFSLLDPHTHIPPHTGVTNTRLIVHLPLIVPEACRFRVGNDTRSWKEGAAWTFDDTIEHEAWNDSDKTRVVLIFDVWNPHMTITEKSLVGPLLQGIDTFYGAS